MEGFFNNRGPDVQRFIDIQGSASDACAAACAPTSTDPASSAAPSSSHLYAPNAPAQPAQPAISANSGISDASLLVEAMQYADGLARRGGGKKKSSRGSKKKSAAGSRRRGSGNGGGSGSGSGVGSVTSSGASSAMVIGGGVRGRRAMAPPHPVLDEARGGAMRRQKDRLAMCPLGAAAPSNGPGRRSSRSSSRSSSRGSSRASSRGSSNARPSRGTRIGSGTTKSSASGAQPKATRSRRAAGSSTSSAVVSSTAVSYGVTLALGEEEEGKEGKESAPSSAQYQHPVALDDGPAPFPPTPLRRRPAEEIAEIEEDMEVEDDGKEGGSDGGKNDLTDDGKEDISDDGAHRENKSVVVGDATDESHEKSAKEDDADECHDEDEYGDDDFEDDFEDEEEDEEEEAVASNGDKDDTDDFELDEDTGAQDKEQVGPIATHSSSSSSSSANVSSKSACKDVLDLQALEMQALESNLRDGTARNKLEHELKESRKSIDKSSAFLAQAKREWAARS